MASINRTIVVLFLGLVAILIQGTVLKSFMPEVPAPDFLLIIVVFLAFYDASVLGAILAFLLGLQFDLFSEMLLGPRAGSLVIVYGVLAALSQRLFVESVFAAFVSVFLSSVMNSIVYIILISDAKPAHTYFLYISLIEALFTALLAPFMFRLLKRIFHRKQAGVAGGLKAARVL